MGTRARTIEVDPETADVLEAQAAERGVSVAQLVAQLVAFVDAQPPIDPGEITALEEQWAAIEAGQPTVTHEKVARWLETWGTPAFKPLL
jgi:predicted transcriptional regulator